MSHFHVKEGFIEGCFIKLYHQIRVLSKTVFFEGLSDWMEMYDDFFAYLNE